MSSQENARLSGPSARLQVTGERIRSATLAELENLAEEQRAAIARDPQHSTKELGDITWEIQKRQWRKETWSPNKNVTKDEPTSS